MLCQQQFHQVVCRMKSLNINKVNSNHEKIHCNICDRKSSNSNENIQQEISIHFKLALFFFSVNLEASYTENKHSFPDFTEVGNETLKRPSSPPQK